MCKHVTIYVYDTTGSKKCGQSAKQKIHEAHEMADDSLASKMNESWLDFDHTEKERDIKSFVPTAHTQT